MQINNISNNPTFAGKSNKTHKESHPVVTLTLDEFINAKDEDLHEIATLQNKQKNKNSTSNFLAACVGVDAVSSFLLKSKVVKNVEGETKVLKAPLSAKLKAGLNSVKGWALGCTAVGVLMRARDVLLNKNEKYAQFEEKNPVLSLLSQIGGLAVGYSAIKTVGKKLSIGEKLSHKMAPITKKFGNLGQKIDNSKFGTRLMELGESFVNSVKTKNPALAKTGTFLLANSVLLLLIGGCLKLSKDAKEVQKNYEHLKSVQNELKQTINK